MRLLTLAFPHLGLSARVLARGPFRLKTSWPRGLARTERSIWNWLSDEVDHPMPAGATLVKVERLLEEALWVLRKKKVVRKSLEELVKEKA